MLSYVKFKNMYDLLQQLLRRESYIDDRIYGDQSIGHGM